MKHLRTVRDSRLLRRVVACLLVIALTLILLIRTIHANKYAVEDTLNRLPWPWGFKSTLIFKKEHLREIWSWEIANGNYPSHAPCGYYLVLPL
jgi:hypothetical protein